MAALTAVLPGCHIYNKFDLPDDNALAQEYVKATEAEADSSAFGNLPWQEVFTDPMLADLITRALDNNKDLRNAKLNVDIAHAQMKGARPELPAFAGSEPQRSRSILRRQHHIVDLSVAARRELGDRRVRQDPQLQARS